MDFLLLTFVPLFVAIDPIGIVPLFLAMSHGFDSREKRRLAFQAVGAAFVFAAIFIMGGSLIFRAIGITSNDFKIAGGLLLLIFSIREIFDGSAKKTDGETPDEVIGIVPLGIPLIAGPATITTVLILRDEYGVGAVFFSMTLNLIMTLVLLVFSERIVRTLGETTFRVIAKVVGIFLAAIGIMMIRRGIEAAIGR